MYFQEPPHTAYSREVLAVRCGDFYTIEDEGKVMKEFLQEIMEALTTALNDLLCWIFFPKQAEVCFQEVRKPFDEEARRLRAAWSYFDKK